MAQAVKPRKPGTFRTGDIVRLKGDHTQHEVLAVYWTPKGDWIQREAWGFMVIMDRADGYELVTATTP